MSLVLLCAGTVGIDSIILSESEDRKVCSFYNLDSIPVVFVIDPITVKKKLFLLGMVHPELLLEILGLLRMNHTIFFFFWGFSQLTLENY